MRNVDQCCVHTLPFMVVSYPVFAHANMLFPNTHMHVSLMFVFQFGNIV